MLDFYFIFRIFWQHYLAPFAKFSDKSSKQFSKRNLLKLGVAAIRLHVKRASQFCHLLGEAA
jgi:hypothetical protein